MERTEGRKQRYRSTGTDMKMEDDKDRKFENVDVVETKQKDRKASRKTGR